MPGNGSVATTVLAVPLPLLLITMQYSITAPGIALGLLVPFTGSLMTLLIFETERTVVGLQNARS